MDSDEIIFESQIGTHLQPYLNDHRIHGIVVLPISAYLEMALAAASEALGPGSYALSEVKFEQALLISESSRTVRMVLSEVTSENATFRIFTLPASDSRRESWTLHAEGRIQRNQDSHETNRDQLLERGGTSRSEKGMEFSLFYFGSSEADFTEDRYKLLIEGAKFADRNGFTAVWTPERHFHSFGGSYPSPAVLSAALAMVTERVGLRAGSVVLPLHHPIRIAEEWSVVDNLSQGRVAISFATGWHADDFVLSPESYADRKAVLLSNLETVRKLWRGESVLVPGGSGKTTEVRLFPLPMQRELPVWLTIVKNPDTYVKAGEIGANVLTNLLGQTTTDLATNIALYRDSRARHGYDPQSGHVTLLLHTFIGDDIALVREKVRGPFCDYLKSTIGIIQNLIKSLDLKIDLERLSAKDMDDLLAYAFERYFQTSALLGTTRRCRPMIDHLKEIGVNEIGCFIDFGVDFKSVMGSLQPLNSLREQSNNGSSSTHFVATKRDALSEIKARCSTLISGTDHYRMLRDRGLQYGPSFRGVRRIWRREGEALGQLEHLPELQAEAEAYQIHPALFEASLQILAAALPLTKDLAAEDLTFLPTRLTRLRVFERPSSQIWSHALIRPGAELHSSAFEGDVRLLNELGEVTVEVTGLRFQRLERGTSRAPQEPLADLLYELQWKPSPFGESQAVVEGLPRERGSWLIFDDDTGVGLGLASRLAARGERCVMICPGQNYEIRENSHCRLNPARPADFEELLQGMLGSNDPPCLGIIHLWSLRAESPEKTTTTTLETAQMLGCDTVIHLVQALVKVNWSQAPGLSLVTRGAQSVDTKTDTISVAQSPLWGLGRVLSVEHPEFACKKIDLDPIDDQEQGQSLFEEVWGLNDEDQVAFRRGSRLVPKLVRGSTKILKKTMSSSTQHPGIASSKTAPDLFRDDGSYLITGGLGSVGLQVARWMIRHGARNLVLVGRKDVSGRAGEVLNDLRAEGAEVKVMKADVAREEQLAGVLAKIEHSMPPLRGIVHAASVIDDSLLVQLDDDRFAAVMKPKVSGAWNLHTLTLNRSLDFFVLFSSAASLLGSIGQGNYVAANSFLDALTYHRRALGLPSIAINWGRWASNGSVAERDLEKRLALRGMSTMAPEDALRVLEQLLRQPTPAQIAVMAVDWPQVFKSSLAENIPPFLSELVVGKDGFRDIANVFEKNESLRREALLTVDPEERQSRLESGLQAVVAGVLRLNPDQVDLDAPLNTLGLDSLMAIEIKNNIDASLGVSLPLVRFLDGPNIAQLAARVLEEMALSESASKFDEVLEMVKQLSDEEARSMLADEKRMMETEGTR